jgi:pantoate--beta-alanine ligase
MKIFSNPGEIKHVLSHCKDKEIGFVPTMGALHKGHISLIKKSIAENDITVVSIFVNATQFNDPEDLKKYPNNPNNDISILESLNVNYLFTPEHNLLYNYNYSYRIIETNFSKELCGVQRGGHFEGVLTVVMKLLNIVNPKKAYFGEKDFQQYKLIKGMAEAFFMNVEIVHSPTIRENDGLALSSRNLLLSKDDRKKAAKFPELLMSGQSDKEVNSQLNEEGFQVDYIKTLNGRRFGAVILGNVRLIDNVKK